MENNRILLIGKNSYIGGFLEEKLEEQGAVVEKASARNREWDKLLLEKYDSVVILAAIVHRRESELSQELYQQVNYELPIEIAEKAKAAGVKQLVFLSTMAVFGSGQEQISLQTKPAPETWYGKSKYQAEQALREMESSQFKIVVLRPPMVYGENCPGNYGRLKKLARYCFWFPDTGNKRSMVEVHTLAEQMGQLILENKSGTYHPQDEVYRNTAKMVQDIRRQMGKKTILISWMNWILLPLSKRRSVFHKMFGNLWYEKKTEAADILQQADIRMAAIDLDGTMLNDEKKVTERTKKALKHANEQGILIVPATGRHYKGIPEEVAGLEGVRYMITTNGAAIYDRANGECVYEDPMSNEFALALLEKLLQYDVLIDAFIGTEAYRSSKDMDYVLQMDVPDVIKDFIRNSRAGVPSLYDYIKENKLKVHKFTLNFKPEGNGGYKDRDAVQKLVEKIGGIACVCGGMSNLELTKASATKGTGLLHLGELLGIHKEQLMAIGDSGNDLEMIKAAGYGIAMGNASEDIKEAARIITKTNEEDGVASIFEIYDEIQGKRNRAKAD